MMWLRRVRHAPNFLSLSAWLLLEVNVVLQILENDSRFEKYFVRMNGMLGNQMWRCLKLKVEETET